MAEQYVVAGLTRKRREVLEQAREAEEHLGRLRATLKHIDATLRLYGVEPETAIRRRKGRSTLPMFRRNEVSCFVFDALRLEPDGLNTIELADYVAERKGWDKSDHMFMVALTDKVGKCLAKHAMRGTLDFEKRGAVNVWWIPPTALPSSRDT